MTRRAASTIAGILALAAGVTVTAVIVSGPLANSTVSPTPIARTVELANPFRGTYRWNGAPVQPTSWPIIDSYMRYSWRDLEPTRGNYTFGAIDQELAAAKARGGTFGFRVSAARTGVVGTAVPDYLVPLMPKAWYFDLNGTHNLAPDWNDPDYLSRLQALLNALGARYDTDPRLGWVDIFAYGDYGEWHVYRWPYPSPTGATQITDANANAIVDMNETAFPHKLLLMQHQTVTTEHTDQDHEAFLYALDHYPKVGIRNDCLGASWFTTEMNYLYSTWPVVAARWKQAPLMTEPCGGNFTAMAPQIHDFHVANIGDGNFGSLSKRSAADVAQWKADLIASGYRIALTSATFPTSITRGTAFSISATWQNAGVTPAYSRWTITYSLRNSSGVAWRAGAPAMDLEQLLPGSRSIVDSFTTSAPAGSYTLSIAAVDPAGYFAPLQLAIVGRAADGSYPLGTVSVH